MVFEEAVVAVHLKWNFYQLMRGSVISNAEAFFKGFKLLISKVNISIIFLK